MSLLFPKAACIYETVQQNKGYWVKLNEKVKRLKLTQNTFDVLEVPLDDDSRKNNESMV
jgi:hypothetical protein